VDAKVSADVAIVRVSRGGGECVRGKPKLVDVEVAAAAAALNAESCWLVSVELRALDCNANCRGL
jgi:hypothetical protein